MAADGAGRGVGFRSDRGPVLAAIMLCTSLVAIEATILSTAVPSIVRDLGGFSQFPWLFSAYLLTQSVTVPLYGKLADSIGRRPVLFTGIALFLAGSVLCGAAWSMPALIVARAVQGIGAGAVQPTCVTVIGDLYTVPERARVQGYLASVWGSAAVVGPALGGIFAGYGSWRWIFFINVPLGAVALWTLSRRFTENVERRPHRLDHAGAAVLTAGSSLVVLGLLEGGVAWRWTAPVSVVVLGAGAVLLAVFVAVERRAAEPVLPLWVFRRRILAGGNLTALVVGALLIGVSSYLPTYAQGVLGVGPLAAGFALAALSIGWPVAASQSGRLYLRIGFRDTALIGTAFVVAGAASIALLTGDTPLWAVALAAFVLGVGFGLSASPTVVALQSVVGWEHRGVVTAANMFSRSLGSALGAAVFGAVANATVISRTGDATTGATPSGGGIPTDVDTLYAATHHVFIGLLVLAVCVVGAVLLMPRRSAPLELAPGSGT